MADYTIELRPIRSTEYLELRNSTDWDPVHEDAAVKALQNDLFTVCIMKQGKLIGIGRVIGDGAMYFYIQDVIVLPQYQRQGAGRMIMEQISEYLLENAPKGSFIGLMAADGSASFYEKFGFTPRPANRPGMYKLIKE